MIYICHECALKNLPLCHKESKSISNQQDGFAKASSGQRLDLKNRHGQYNPSLYCKTELFHAFFIANRPVFTKLPPGIARYVLSPV